MAAITVDVSEWDRITVRMRVNVSRVGPAGAKIVRRHTLAVEATAKLLAPVDTGFLKNSIGSSFLGSGRSGLMTGVVTAAAKYAGWVEEGTSRIAPRPFMRPALDLHSLPFVHDVVQLGSLITSKGSGEPS